MIFKRLKISFAGKKSLQYAKRTQNEPSSFKAIDPKIDYYFIKQQSVCQYQQNIRKYNYAADTIQRKTICPKLSLVG